MYCRVVGWMIHIILSSGCHTGSPLVLLLLLLTDAMMWDTVYGVMNNQLPEYVELCSRRRTCLGTKVEFT